MRYVEPGKFTIRRGDLTAKVRTCIAVVVEPMQMCQNFRGMIHFSGNQVALYKFLSQIRQQIPFGVAMLAGAASYSSEEMNIGPGKNLDLVLKALDASNIPVISMDVGGRYVERSVATNPQGVYSKRRPYSPVAPVRRGLHYGYEEIDGQVEILKL